MKTISAMITHVKFTYQKILAMNTSSLLSRTLVLCLLLSSLLGCEKIGDPLDPDIGEIQRRINHYHPTLLDPDANTDDPTVLKIDIEFKITDPEGLNNIADVDIKDLTNDATYHLVARSASTSIGPNFDNARSVFRLISGTPVDSTRISFSDWSAYVEDLRGYKEEKFFSFLLPDGEEATSDQYVYSPQIDSFDADGVPAMQVMTITDNDLSFSKDTESEYFTVAFTTDDLRAKNYQLYFFDSSRDQVGAAPFDAPSIESNPINLGGQTSLTLHWEEIAGITRDQARTIIGVHIILFDEAKASDVVSGEFWFNFAGASEYIPEGTE